MTFDARLLVQLAANLTSPLDLSSVSAPLPYGKQFVFTDGSGVNQATKMWHDQRTIAPSGTDALDLAGVLVDPFGVAITFARVKGLLISAASGNTNNVVVGAGTNPVTTIMGGTTPTVIVRPGGLFMLVAPDVTAYVVTPATADILQIANSAAGTSVTYDIVVIGA